MAPRFDVAVKHDLLPGSGALGVTCGGSQSSAERIGQRTEMPYCRPSLVRE